MIDHLDNHDERRSRPRLGMRLLGIVSLAVLIVVLLVLTGIIAEPETVIEGIRRALFGG